MKTAMNILVTFLSIVLVVNYGQSQLPWDLVESGTTLQLNGVDFITPDTGIVVGAGGLILKTTNGGEVWETIDAGITTNLNAVCYVSESRVIAVGNSGAVIKSEDGGETWEVVPLGASITLGGVSIDRTSGKGLISGATLAMIWTDDFGLTWTAGMGGYMSDFYKAHMTEGDFGVAFGVNSIFQPLLGYTDDAGASFDMWNFYPTSGGVNYEANARDGYFFTKNDGFVVGHVWDGQGFITQEINWSTHSWNCTFVSTVLNAIDFNGVEYGVTVGGTANNWVFLETTDGGTTWEPPVVNGNGKGFNDVSLIGNTGYAVGYSGQIVKKQVPVGIETLKEESVQMHISPNPANDLAVATLLLNGPHRIDLVLCDLYGRTLRTIPQGELPAGRRAAPINLSGLNQGTYLVKLMVDNRCVGGKKLVISRYR